MAADSRRQRDGRFLEILGHYNPIAQPFELVVEKDKVQTWLDQGAQPSQQVASLLRSSGMMLGKASKPTKKAAPAGTAVKPRRRVKPRKLSAAEDQGEGREGDGEEDRQGRTEEGREAEGGREVAPRHHTPPRRTHRRRASHGARRGAGCEPRILPRERHRTCAAC